MALDAQANDQFEEQRQIHIKHKRTYQLMGGITLLVVGIWIGAQLFGGDAGFTTNLYTEALSIGVTVLVLNWFADRRATNQRKQELFLQLGSQSNDFALEAKRQLQQLGWLEEALAQKVFVNAGWQRMGLARANLEGFLLAGTNLSEANLWQANLSSSRLDGSDLSRSHLVEADLSDAKLLAVNLSGAAIVDANFSNAWMLSANLTGAVIGSTTFHKANLLAAKLREAIVDGVNLTEADLSRADLTGTRFNGTTTLPDGTRWTPDTDMARFTDPHHPQFWRSDDPASPAYRGRS